MDDLYMFCSFLTTSSILTHLGNHMTSLRCGDLWRIRWKSYLKSWNSDLDFMNLGELYSSDHMILMILPRTTPVNTIHQALNQDESLVDQELLPRLHQEQGVGDFSSASHQPTPLEHATTGLRDGPLPTVCHEGLSYWPQTKMISAWHRGTAKSLLEDAAKGMVYRYRDGERMDLEMPQKMDAKKHHLQYQVVITIIQCGVGFALIVVMDISSCVSPCRMPMLP